MNLIVNPGDTLTNIAANYTLSDSYAVGLANFNNLDASTINAAAVDPADALTPDGTMMLAVGQTLIIPDNWLKQSIPAVYSSSPAAPSSPATDLTLSKFMPMLFIAGVILTMWYITGNHHGEPVFEGDDE